MHTVLLKDNNDVLIFGANKYGQLGLGNNYYQNKPVTLMQGIAIRQIACGGLHTVILQDDNDVLVFGRNHYGQLGLGHNDNQNKPITLMQGIYIRQIACGRYHTVILQDDNDVLVFGENDKGQLGLGHNRNQNKPVTLMQGIAVRQIACGDNHIVSLRAKAQTNLPLGTRSLLEKIRVSFLNKVILQDDNDVLVFGANGYGQLGLEHNDDQNKPMTLMQ